MQQNQTRGRTIGGPLEYTVSEVLDMSIDVLIDRGVRFNIVNDDDKDEEECNCDYGTDASEVHQRRGSRHSV